MATTTFGVTAAAKFIPELWASEGLNALGNYVTFAKLATRNWDSAFAKMGDTVNVRKPFSFTILDKAEQTAVTRAVPTADTVAVVLNKHKYLQIQPEDVVRAEAQPELMQQILMDGMVAMADAIDAAGIAEAANFSGTSVGTQGTAAGTTSIIDAHKILVSAKMPKGAIANLVVGAQTESDLLKQSLFHQADTSGTMTALEEARLGRKFGFDIYVNQGISRTGSPAGDKNLYFHPSAMTLATRPLPLPTSGVQAAFADLDGIGIRVTKAWDQTELGEAVTLDVLFGFKAVRPELGGIMYGA